MATWVDSLAWKTIGWSTSYVWWMVPHIWHKCSYEDIMNCTFSLCLCSWAVTLSILARLLAEEAEGSEGATLAVNGVGWSQVLYWASLCLLRPSSPLCLLLARGGGEGGRRARSEVFSIVVAPRVCLELLARFLAGFSAPLSVWCMFFSASLTRAAACLSSVSWRCWVVMTASLYNLN